MSLRLLLLAIVPLSCKAQYEAFAALLNTTQGEILQLGGLPDLDCSFKFNNTPENCERLISGITDPEQQECGCYNFCGTQQTGCYEKGKTPPIFSCNSIYSVVAGCQQNQTIEPPLLSASGNNETNQPCPPGYMCTRGKQRLCEEIRQIPLQLGLGDFHAGMYCPGRPNREQNGYENCPLGYYCPNSTTKLPCPEGFFCPHKTMKPEIVCTYCPEGSQSLKREPYGYTVGIVVVSLMSFLVVYELFKRYNSGLYEHWRELRGRNFDRVKATVQARKRQERLKRLEPKLKIIERRLGQDSGEYRANPDASVHALSTKNKSGRITFDPRKLFSMMDTNKDGLLTKEEIGHALDLNETQMREFMRRMNQEARVPAETDTVSRDAFVKSFLRVLEQISHFEPTPTEAGELFDEILASKSTVDVDGILHEDLFDSSIATFLDDTQINRMIKRFRELQEKQSQVAQRVEVDYPLDTNGADMDISRGERTMVGRRRQSSSSLMRTIKRASIHRPVMDADGEINRFKFKRPSILTFMHKYDVITREEFVAWYPPLLMEVTHEAQVLDNSAVATVMSGGIDIAFKDLSLTVNVKNTDFKIVDDVTGRLQAGTMTALMGGSGAGKTSLLNALCGRAFYGKVTGSVKINGHETTIEEHSSAVGFVPQDDIVYAELTVRENFIFAGRFKLPKGTPKKEIVDLADATMANLGLSRVMHSLVGDVTRRGLSGGEKKRVNIGLELMARPKILFLDEPTSGLDANSALLVMESLKSLSQVYGTTICSVIHQPRKFIFELFDSLILLGVGGKMVYHGPVSKVETYFNSLQYYLPPGESIADWLIDISSGRLGPSTTMSDHSGHHDDSQRDNQSQNVIVEETSQEEDNTNNSVDVDKVEDMLSNPGNVVHAEKVEAVVETPTREVTSSNLTSTLPDNEDRLMINTCSTLSFMELDRSKILNNPDSIFDEDPAAQAKARREILYTRWVAYMAQLPEEEREIYEASEPYDLPEETEKASFGVQLWNQLRRMALVGQRNWVTKTIDTAIIVGSTVLVCLLDGIEKPTSEIGMGGLLNYDYTAEPTSIGDVVREFPKLFTFAFDANIINLQGFGTKAGILLAVLLALTATKTITTKRKEFFREAASGYSTNAYFLAVNIITTIEHTIQATLCALCSIWFRCAIAHWSSWLVPFILCAWIAVSWAFVIALTVPLDNVVLVACFFMVISCLLLSGAIMPFLYKTIYQSEALQVLTGLVSSTRFFIEALALSESMALPAQSGFTGFGPNLSGGMYLTTSTFIMGLGINDFYVATQQTFNGWKGGAWPAFVVGLWLRWTAAGLIHVSDRPKQAKQPLIRTMARNPIGFLWLFIYSVLWGGLLAAAIYLILRRTSEYDDQPF